jgi:hypothetical protein
MAVPAIILLFQDETGVYRATALGRHEFRMIESQAIIP